MLPIKDTKDGAVMSVQVLPHSSRSEIVGIKEDVVKIKLTSPPLDGRANDGCIALVSKAFGIRKGNIEIVTGLKGRKKTILFQETNAKDLELFFTVDGNYKKC